MGDGEQAHEHKVDFENLAAVRPGIVQQFRDLYYMARMNGRCAWDTKWLDIPMWKAPTDLWTLQEMIIEQAPEVVIECGVYCGGSAAFLFAAARMVQQIEFVGIDITLANLHPTAAKISVTSKPPHKLEFIESSSTNEGLVTQLRERFKDKRVMVILDSDHTYGHVLREMELYAPFVPVGGYMVVEDTNVDRLCELYDIKTFKNNGPARAVREFLAQHPDEWGVDETCERQMLTLYPGGFLRRLKA